jgi:hypothetical protein
LVGESYPYEIAGVAAAAPKAAADVTINCRLVVAMRHPVWREPCPRSTPLLIQTHDSQFRVAGSILQLTL